MKKEVSPAVVWGILAVVGIAVIVIGYKMLVPSVKVETKGSETDMARVKSGQPLYQPPADAPVPRPPGAGGGGGGMGGAPAGGGGGYNLTPPTR